MRALGIAANDGSRLRGLEVIVPGASRVADRLPVVLRHIGRGEQNVIVPYNVFVAKLRKMRITEMTEAAFEAYRARIERRFGKME